MHTETVEHTDYNVYCDESCHLEHDRQPIMALGSVWCPRDQVREMSTALRALKRKHIARGEMKWTKVSASRLDFYEEVVNLFFQTPYVHFRCLVVEDKNRLDHAHFNRGSHDAFYYKMYYYLLRNILLRDSTYAVYLDIKDTRSQQKVVILNDILKNHCRSIERCSIARIQHIRSHESELLQLADLLLGAVSYANRQVSTNTAKIALIRQVTRLAQHRLTQTTTPWESKFNVFKFSPSEKET